MRTKRELPRTPLALAVMTLLMECPMHPYEMKLKIKQRGHDRVIRLAGGSIYDTVERLEEGGFITSQAPTREGRRPERTVYAITETGRREITAWLRDLITEPVNEYPQFAAALAFLAVLDKDEVVRLLQLRIAKLEREMAETETMLEQLQKALAIPRLFLIEIEYGVVMNRAELEWIRSLIHDIQEGKVWITHEEMHAVEVRLGHREEGG
jgi:DNA-binding PadR family transcriptional regulator